MEMEQIEQKLREIIRKNATILGLKGINIDEIKNTDNFVSDVGVDSLGLMALVSEVEKTFDIKISDGELAGENFGDIACAVSYIRKKMDS